MLTSFLGEDFSPITVRVPATSANLGPGFDALGLAFQLHNELSLLPAQQDSSEIIGQGAGRLPLLGRTIAHAAAHRVFDELGLSVEGLHLVLRNQIPLSRGLGSSSAAIVGGLVAANLWCRRENSRSLTSSRLLDLATEVEGHPDNVAPALLGGCVAAVTGRSGHVAAVAVPVQQWPAFLVFIPEVELATRAARGVLPELYSRADAVFNLSRSALLVAALAAGKLSALPEALQDKIHQEQRAPLVPGFHLLAAAAQAAGAYGTTLSGAGPSILFWLPVERAAEIGVALRTIGAESGLGGTLRLLEVETAGCREVD